MPIVYGDTLILSANTAGVSAIRPRLRDGAWVVGAEYQLSRFGGVYISSRVIVQHPLDGFSRRASEQTRRDRRPDGRTQWLGTPRWADNVAFVKAGDVLFLLRDDGDLVVAQGQSSGLRTARPRLTVADSATWAQPVISGRRVFIKDVSTVTLWTID